MTKKVLVVGGAGYIGGSVTDNLLAEKIPFTVYDNLTYENHYLKPIDFIYGDVRDKKKLKKILPHYSHVIWLAAIVGDGACAIKPDITKQVNQDAVGWLSKNYTGKIIFTSTCSVYGLSKDPVTEISPTNPLSVYAQTKLEAEKYLFNRDAIIYRLGTAFGLSDTYSRIRMDLAINYITMTAVKQKKIKVFGGTQWRPFIHVKDIGNTIVRNLVLKHTGIYNLTTSNATIIEIARLIQQATKCKIQITSQTFQDNRSYHAITEKGIKEGIYKKLKKHTIINGITEIKELVETNRIKNVDLEQYSNERYLLKAMQQYENF